MKNKTFVLGAVVLVVGVFAALNFFSKPKSEAPPKFLSKQESTESFTRPHSPTYGNTLARVTVVEWFDPECESCSAFHSVFEKIIEDYKDRVNFVLRYMPYHQSSLFAASALEEAREFGKFEAALRLLFEKQPEWGDHHAPKPDLIPEYLATLGIPKEKLNREYLIKKHEHKIRMDEEDGQRVGVRGTPTFFVNGQTVDQLGDRPLRDAIDRALNAAL